MERGYSVGDSDDDKDIYDVPPPPRLSRSSHSESDYMNFKEMDVIPIPSLPPKKRMSVDLDEKFGISRASVDQSNLQAQVTHSPSVKKAPVAAPRSRSVDTKRPVAPPRKSRVDGFSGVLLTDATITESDVDVCDNRAINGDDRSNNNQSGLCDSNFKIASNREDFRPYENNDVIYELPEVADGLDQQRGERSYANMTYDLGYFESKVPSVEESKPVHLKTLSPSVTVRRSVSCERNSKFGEPSSPGQMPRNCTDESKCTMQNYINMNQFQLKNTAGINLKELMVSCMGSTGGEPFVQGQAASSSNKTAAGDTSHPLHVNELTHDVDLAFLDALLVEPSSKLNRSTYPLGDRSSRNSELVGLPPPEFSPPPLPDNLLIDLSEANNYKTFLRSAPVVPIRPEPVPPVPARKGIGETLEYADHIVISSSSPSPAISRPTEQTYLEAANVVPYPDKQDRKLPKVNSATKAVDASKASNAGSKSMFYVDSTPELYETDLGIYEMEDNTSTQRDQSSACIGRGGTSQVDGSVGLQGVLYLSTNGPKPERKWCRLEAGVGSLNICPINQRSNPSEVIERVSMVSIANVKDERPGNWFELSTRPPTAYYQFSAESSAEKVGWMTQIAKAIALVTVEDFDQISEVERGGNAFVRFGAESEWTHTWLHLVHKTLYIYKKNENFDEIDLRKSKGLRNLPFADRCTKGFEACSPLSIDLPNGRVIYIQSDLKKDQDGWFSALRNSMTMFDGTLANQALTSDSVPVLVDKCINFVSAYGLETEGIYRLNGQTSRVTKLLEDFRSDTRGMIIRSPDYHINDVANAMKRFFRQLDEPLLTNNLYKAWLEASAIVHKDSRLDAYKSLLDCLPHVNFCTLKRIIFHIAQVVEKDSVNKMNSTNMASIFGPILMKVDKDSQPTTGFGTTNQEIKIIKDLVDCHQWLFDIKEEELNQEKKIADAVKRIEMLNMAKSGNSVPNTILEEGVLMGVYINNREGDVITLKIPGTMTAAELCTYAAGKAKVSTNVDWALFEIICNGELERPIRSFENILEVTMKWSNWPQEFCQDNYLCFKFNKLLEPLQLVYEHQSSLFSELLYASKKNFHKYCFQYSQCCLGFRKDSRAENPTTSWPVEDIVLYVGVQQLRRPSTKWGFTFFSTAEKLVSPYFGHSICCTSEEEMYRWLSAMWNNQHFGNRPSRAKPIPAENHSPPLGSRKSESNAQTSNLPGKWKLPFVKRR